MAIQPTDIVLVYSIKTGSAGYTTASNAASSLGKYASTTEISSGVLYNLFPTLTGDQNSSGASDYKCVFVHNKHATLTLIAPVIWLTSLTASSTTYSIGLDSNPVSAQGATSAQAALIATTANAPAGVTFSAPISKSTGIVLGDIPPLSVIGIWIQRKANNTGALASDSVTLALDGDTQA
jgi:hypothetical protein